MIAVISLRSEEEISIDSFTDDLKSALNYPVYSDELDRDLQYLRRSGLVSINWQSRTIKREKLLSEYVKKNVFASETWTIIAEDWRRINTSIQNKHKTVNNDYQNNLLQNKENQHHL